MTRSVLVLGAKGRFGRASVAAFSEAGWRVSAMTRDGTLGEAAPSVARIKGDCLDGVQLARAAEGHDVIVNAVHAPYPEWAEFVPRLTDAVLMAARSSGATVLIPGNVYNFGAKMPRSLSAATRHAAEAGKGRIRRDMEAAFRAAEDVQTIVLRAGDFIDTRASGNWFDMVMTKDLAKGRFTYPGAMDVPHSWAYLPDMAAAAVSLSSKRAALPRFADIPFTGYTVTGEEIRAALGRLLGKPLRHARFPWWFLRFASPFKRDWAELLEMRYLWEVPHGLEDGVSAHVNLPPQTPLEDALKAAVGGSTRR